MSAAYRLHAYAAARTPRTPRRSPGPVVTERVPDLLMARALELAGRDVGGCRAVSLKK